MQNDPPKGEFEAAEYPECFKDTVHSNMALGIFDSQ